jgi:hypothetical protein
MVYTENIHQTNHLNPGAPVFGDLGDAEDKKKGQTKSSPYLNSLSISFLTLFSFFQIIQYKNHYQRTQPLNNATSFIVPLQICRL